MSRTRESPTTSNSAPPPADHRVMSTRTGAEPQTPGYRNGHAKHHGTRAVVNTADRGEHPDRSLSAGTVSTARSGRANRLDCVPGFRHLFSGVTTMTDYLLSDDSTWDALRTTTAVAPESSDPPAAGLTLCPDCGAAPGALHADGCGLERCPVCSSPRLAGCGCASPTRLPWDGQTR